MRVLVVVVSGVLLLAFAVLVVSSCEPDAQGMHGIVVCLGIVGAIARLAFMGGSGAKIAPGSEVSPDSARRGPPDPRPQLAGSTCPHCERKIMVETEAVLCKTCGKPLHRECRKQHKVDAHRPVSGQAYR